MGLRPKPRACGGLFLIKRINEERCCAASAGFRMVAFLDSATIASADVSRVVGGEDFRERFGQFDVDSCRVVQFK